MTKQQIFRASEILDMAVQIEHQGLAFYQACAEASEEADVRSVFRYMIDQERKHVQIFSQMKQGVDDYQLPESYPGEARSYIDSFVRDQVFSSPEQVERQAREISDPRHAVDVALQFEKASILFYSGIKDVVRPSEHDAIERVISEEHGHVRRLLELRRSLTEET